LQNKKFEPIAVPVQ